MPQKDELLFSIRLRETYISHLPLACHYYFLFSEASSFKGEISISCYIRRRERVGPKVAHRVAPWVKK